MMSNENKILVSGRNITKSYYGNVVLDDVSFDIRSGEVHSLVGENGAGKSTLVKIITGVTERDCGELNFDGHDLPMEFPRNHIEKLGVSVIFQELSLIPGLTVAQNIFLGREPRYKNSRIINRKKMLSDAGSLIRQYGFPLDPKDEIDSLSIGQRQLVEILKALSNDSKLMIMDEPTASLNMKESKLLFEIIKGLREKGVSILYISHRMEEVFDLSDRVTVLRDGEKISLLERDEISPERIISLMIGRDLSQSEYEDSVLKSVEGDVILEVENLTSDRKFSDISFNLKKGEVLGISGLVGSGRTEIVRAIYGADEFNSGTVRFDGREIKPSVKQSIDLGFGFVPEDRREQGVFMPLSIGDNICASNFDKYTRFGFVNEKAESALANDGVDLVSIKPKDPDYTVGNLSGGNQQKVVLAKWLVRDLSILIIDEPTAGIDVGAKDEIYSIINKLAEQGVGVILISSDLPELTRLSDRILVLREGRLIKEFRDQAITEEDVLKASSGLL
jgi:ribose transport system ATP-binding protein